MTSRGWVAALLSGALLAVSRDTGRFDWLVLASPKAWHKRQRRRWRCRSPARARGQR